MKQLILTQSIQAPIDDVWGRITDHEAMPEWSPLKRVVLESIGEPERNGVGAVRRMMGAGPTIVEEVVEWDAPNSYVYRLRKGAPIRDHRGTVELSEEVDGTRVVWRIEFRPIVPGTGWLMVAALRIAIGGMLKQLKTLLEAPSSH